MQGLHSTGIAAGKNRIYLDYYGLKESPFSITPDPEFLFASNTHQNVIDKICYGIENRLGFILLIGEVGTGKTTICRTILDRLDGRNKTVFIINPALSGNELISTLLDDLGIIYPPGASKKELIDRLNRFLLKTSDSYPAVIIIDDAQTIPVDTLEDLRLLSNLETDKAKLLQILLVGQPELENLISTPGMRQLRQRISITCRLGQITREEIQGYISRRLFIGGDQGHIRFTKNAIKKIYKSSGGVPRVINKICDYALTAAYVSNDFVIGPHHVKRALMEIEGVEHGKGFIKTVIPGPWKNSYLKISPVFVSTIIFFTVMFSFNHVFDPSNLNNEKNAYGLAYTTEKVTATETEIPGRANYSQTSTLIPGQMDLRATDRPARFTLMLSSERTLNDIVKKVSVYNKKGLDVYWTKVNMGKKGLWYRLVTGRFKTVKEARQFKKEHNLEGSVVISAPWMVLAAKSTSPEDIDEIRKVLRKNQYDCHIYKEDDDLYRIVSGPFVTQEGAQGMAMVLEDLGLAAKVIPR
jgi:general secretion pathway protein A